MKPIFFNDASKALTAGTNARHALDSFDAGVLLLMLQKADVHVGSALPNVPSTLIHAASCLDVTDADAA